MEPLWSEIPEGTGSGRAEQELQQFFSQVLQTRTGKPTWLWKSLEGEFSVACALLCPPGSCRASSLLLQAPMPCNTGLLPSPASSSGSPSLLWYLVPSYSVAILYGLESLKKTPDFVPWFLFPTLIFMTFRLESVVRATFLCFKYFTHPPFRSSLEAHSAFPSAFGTLASQVILHVLSEQPGEGKGSDFPPGPTTQSSYSGTVDVGKAEDPLPSLRKWNLFQHDKNFTCRQKVNQEKVNYLLWMTKQMLHRDHEITGREENLYLFRTNVTRRVKSTNVNYFTNRNKNLVLSKYDQTPFSLQISGTFSNWRCNE